MVRPVVVERFRAFLTVSDRSGRYRAVIDQLQETPMRYDELLDAIQADRARATEAETRRRLLVRSRQGRTGSSLGRAARAWFRR
jgi:hypothetical protein